MKKKEHPLDAFEKAYPKERWERPVKVKEWVPVYSSQQQDWKPIELAPKDGCVVVARNAGGFTMLVQWTQTADKEGKVNGGFWSVPGSSAAFVPHTWLCALKP